MSQHAAVSHHDDYQCNKSGQVVLCAWCWPMIQDFIRRYPELKEREFTHGICPKHKNEVLQGALLANSKN